MRPKLLLVACLVLGTSTVAVAQPVKLKEVKIESKAAAYKSAAALPFGEALGLSYSSLSTLGSRIEQARRSGDPVGLIAAAKELAVAEEVSGKKVELTADALTKEAIALAKLRAISSELKAVSLFVADPAAKKDLEAAIGPAKDQEAKDTEDMKARFEGEKAKGIFNELVVFNDSHHVVNIYVNGQYVGHVHPHQHEHFHVHTHGHTDLAAVGGGHRWDHHFDQDYNTYRWRIWE